MRFQTLVLMIVCFQVSLRPKSDLSSQQVGLIDLVEPVRAANSLISSMLSLKFPASPNTTCLWVSPKRWMLRGWAFSGRMDFSIDLLSASFCENGRSSSKLELPQDSMFAGSVFVVSRQISIHIFP
jgi:hypothetical protein